MLSMITKMGVEMDESHSPLSQEEADALTKKIHAWPKEWYGEGLGACIDNTRTAVLKEIQNWATQADSLPIMCLDGIPRSGKSAIARSVAVWAEHRDILGAAMYLNAEEWHQPYDLQRGPPSRRLCFAMMRQLLEPDTKWANRFRQTIGRTVIGLEYPPYLADDLISAYIVKPVPKECIIPKDPLVIIVDSLDSTANRISGLPDRGVLDTLLMLLDLPYDVKILVTTRSGRVCNQALEHLSWKSCHGKRRLSLSVYDEYVCADMRTFFTKRLSEVPAYCWEYDACGATPDEIKGLAAYATSVSFGMAVKMGEFIADAEVCGARERLRAIIYESEPDKGWSAYCQDQWETFYRWALDESGIHNSQAEVVVGNIAICRSPLPMDVLGVLTGRGTMFVEPALNALMRLSLGHDPPKFHKCFLEFICDRMKAKNHSIMHSLHEEVAVNSLVNWSHNQGKLQALLKDEEQVGRSVRSGGACYYAEYNWAYHASQSGATRDSKVKEAVEALEDTLFDAWVGRMMKRGKTAMDDVERLHEWAVCTSESIHVRRKYTD